jgi:hypothetical protein
MFCSRVFEVSDEHSDLPVGSLNDDALLARSHAVEIARRRVEADQVVVLGEIERRGLHTIDGHRGIDSYGRGVHRWSTRAARAAKQLIRLCRAFPDVLDRLQIGQVGVAQAQLLAATFAHARVGHLLGDVLAELLDEAAVLDLADFDDLVTRWRLLVDQDGGDPERAMTDRSATLTHDECGYRLHANGPAIDAVTLAAVLARYEQVEFDLDWAAVVAEHGDQAAAVFMPRTRQQRRHDALIRIFEDAVATAPGAAPNEPLVNLIIDPDTLAETIDTLFADLADDPTAAHDPRRSDGQRPSGQTSTGRWRCSQTTDGVHVPPIDVVFALLRGQIRKVLTDRRGVVLDMGHRQRLFTGATRQAVMLAATRCTQPGCLVKASESQADHLTPHSHGGKTATINGGPTCGHHNRHHYTTNLTTTLDQHGRWTTRRADGTNLAPPDHPHHPAA